MQNRPNAQRGQTANNQQQKGIYQQSRKVTYRLLRNSSTKNLSSWTKYLLKYDIQIVPFDNTETLFFIELDCEKHLLVKDLQQLYQLQKISYQWTQTYQFNGKLTDLSNEIPKFIIPWSDVSFQDLCFFVEEGRVELISLIPNNIDQNQQMFEEQKRTLLQNLDSYKLTNKPKNLLEIVQNALQFISEKLQKNQSQNKFQIDECLLQRMQMKLDWDNKWSVLEKQISKTVKDIVQYIQQLRGQVLANYVIQFLSEQSIEALEAQEKFLKILSLEGPITNEHENTLLYQGQLQQLVQSVQETINDRIQMAEKIKNSPINLKDIETHKLIYKLIYSTQPETKQNKLKQQQNQPIAFEKIFKQLSQIFIEELSNQYWILSDLQEGKMNYKTQDSLQKFFETQNAFFIANWENKQALKIVMNQMIRELSEKDEFAIISLLLGVKLDSISELLKTKVPFLGKLQINDNEKKNYLDKLKQNPQLQNEILVLVYSQFQENFEKYYKEKQKQGSSFETNIKQMFFGLINKAFDRKLDQQLLILQESLKKELYSQLQGYGDFEFLQCCFEEQYLQQYTNPLCKNETIILTQQYRDLTDKIRSCWPQYFILSSQILQIFPQQNMIENSEQIRIDLLRTCFKNYIFFNQEDAFNFQYVSYKLQKEITIAIAEKLQLQILGKIQEKEEREKEEKAQEEKDKQQKEQEEKKLKQEQINKKIAAIQLIHRNAYIPFKIIEKVILDSLNQDENEKNQLQQYEQISEALQKKEQEDLDIIINITQLRINDWQRSVEKSSAINKLQDLDPIYWNVEQLEQNIEQSRFVFFLPERKQYKLKTAITQIHNAYNNECNEILNTPPVLQEFDLNINSKIPIDDAISVDTNERLFTISIKFLEQVYQFYEKQIEIDLEIQLE